MSFLPRPTPLFVVSPRGFLDPEAAKYLDIIEWSETFEWQADDWGGWKDTVDPVPTIIDSQIGDCDDYAAVVASWAIANNLDATLLYCWEPGSFMPTPDHIAVAVCDYVYSSGLIRPITPEEYIRQSKYARLRTRTVS